jgi:hypothetical protein
MKDKHSKMFEQGKK